jgi:hypothetical protein
MSIENCCVAFGVVPFAAMIVTLNTPGTMGVPERTPPGAMSRPGGSPAALKIIGFVPVAVQV